MEDANPSLICSMAIITPVKQVLGKVPEATGGSKNYFSVLMDKQKRSETSEVRNHTQPPTRSPRGVTVRQNKRSLGTRGTMRSSWGYQFFTHRPPNSRFSVNRTWGGNVVKTPNVVGMNVQQNNIGWHPQKATSGWTEGPHRRGYDLATTNALIFPLFASSASSHIKGLGHCK